LPTRLDPGILCAMNIYQYIALAGIIILLSACQPAPMLSSDSGAATPQQATLSPTSPLPSLTPTPSAAPTISPTATSTPRPPITIYNIYVGKDVQRQPELIKTPLAPIIRLNQVDNYLKSYADRMFLGKQVNGEDIRGEKETLLALNRLLDAALKKEFVSQTIQSSYRSYEDQVFLEQKYKIENNDYLAPPGRSEHHLGTAIDLAWGTERLDYYIINSNPLAQKYYDWLKENAHQYGFVFSYPYKASPDRKRTNLNEPYITEYKAEPWHIRYVGLEMAQRIFFTKDEEGRNYLDPASPLVPQMWFVP